MAFSVPTLLATDIALDVIVRELEDRIQTYLQRVDRCERIWNEVEVEVRSVNMDRVAL